MKIKIDEKLISELMTEQIKERIDSEVSSYCYADVFNSIATEYISDKLANIFNNNPNSDLTFILRQVLTAEVLQWFNMNLTMKDMHDTLKDALLERLREFDLEEIKILINQIK